jgi:ataxia telangiectasia mutated family protein
MYNHPPSHQSFFFDCSITVGMCHPGGELTENQRRRLQHHQHTLEKECRRDGEERARVELSVQRFLRNALCQYGKALAYSDQPDDLRAVFTLVSLWFNHTSDRVNRTMGGVHAGVSDSAMQSQETQDDDDGDEGAVEGEGGVIQLVPSYKFVPLIYQIASRLGSAEDDQDDQDDDYGDAGQQGGCTEFGSTSGAYTSSFQRVLRVLLSRLAREHPHHSIVQLIALSNGRNVKGANRSEHFSANVGDDKIVQARELLEKLRQESPELRQLVESNEALTGAYIEMAMIKAEQWYGQKNIPLSQVKLASGKTFDKCLRRRAIMPAVLTRTVATRADCDYSDVVTVQRFDTMFCLTESGIHRPRIVVCIGSDGERYKQLVKGQDDCRQDLVIEQVFDTVNTLLQRAPATRKRQLKLRT